MIDPRRFRDRLVASGVGLFTGVPDSLLSDFCAAVAEPGLSTRHVLAANEGNAAAIAVGYHLATDGLAAVYLQNSGLGNAVNPLVSLAVPDVYGIPLLLVIGWRGEPGVADEPQHVKQGRISREMLELMGITTWMVDASTDIDAVVAEACGFALRESRPVAFLVRKDAFSRFDGFYSSAGLSQMSRESALEGIVGRLDRRDLVIATTGKLSRELYEIRTASGSSACSDFLTVGGMGHASSIALGAALGQPRRRVVCLDGDGALLMHMGALPVIAALSPSNFFHVLFNNGAHESVGGQPTVAGRIDVASVAKACGYVGYRLARSREEIVAAWAGLSASPGPAMMEIQVSASSRGNLGRPRSTPAENKAAFMERARDWD